MNKEELTQRRIALGLSQKELAELLGVSRALACHWEKGERPLRKMLFMSLEVLEAQMICPSCKQLIKRRVA